MIFGKCKLHKTRSGVVQILSKFFRNKHKMLDGTTYDQHEYTTAADRQLGKNYMFNS